jgi:hypothetical protein
MFYEREVNILVLDKNENLLGFLHPNYVQITERNEEKGLREIEIIHPLTDDNNQDLSKYNNLLQHGNKIWREHTSDGNSCLYVLIDDKQIDASENQLTITAEEIATELNNLPPIPLNPYPVYFEDWEDGAYSIRSGQQYMPWTLVGGTVTMNNTTPISGRYTLRHAGNGSITANNLLLRPNTRLNRVISFKFKMISAGAQTYGPYACLWKFRRVSASYDVALWTWYDPDNDKQIIELFTVINGVGTVVKDAELMNGKMPIGITYDFLITDNGQNIKVYIDGSEKLDVNYETDISASGYVGFGCNEDSIAEWEEIYTLQDPPDPQGNQIIVDEDFMIWLFGHSFVPGIIESNETATYDGSLKPLALLREIEDQTGYEFNFRYEYDEEQDKIIRYLDFLEKKGKTHTKPIEIGYNTDNIEYEETEADVALAAALAGKPSDDSLEASAKFHKLRLAWEGFSVAKDEEIPLWVTKDEQGNETMGPLAAAPYVKERGKSYVEAESGDSSSSYKYIQEKEKGGDSIPRTITFESTEENMYNLYWLAVGKINEHLQPQVQLSTDVVDIGLLNGYDPSYYNVGDTVALQLPGTYNRVQARVTKTTKNPREPEKDKIELGNYQIDFFADYLQTFYPRSEPYQNL